MPKRRKRPQGCAVYSVATVAFLKKKARKIPERKIPEAKKALSSVPRPPSRQGIQIHTIGGIGEGGV